MFGESVKILPKARIDHNGERVETDRPEVDLDQCIIEGMDSSDLMELDRQGVDGQVRVYTPRRSGVVIRPRDRIVVRGHQLAVTGVVDDWVDPEEPEFGGWVITARWVSDGR